MALMNCPECDKVIADKALACPYCGFGIRAYLARSPEEKRIEEAWKEANIKIEEELVEKEKEYYQEQRNEVRIPDKPKRRHIAGLAVTYWSFAAMAVIVAFNRPGYPLLSFICIGFAIFLFSVPIKEKEVLNKTKEQHDREWEEYNAYLAAGSREKYIDMKVKDKPPFNREWQREALQKQWKLKINPTRKELIEAAREELREEERQEYFADLQEKYKAQFSGFSTGEKCPFCGSYRVKRIGGISWLVSVSFLGFASNSIGKTYRCTECNHMW